MRLLIAIAGKAAFVHCITEHEHHGMLRREKTLEHQHMLHGDDMDHGGIDALIEEQEHGTAALLTAKKRPHHHHHHKAASKDEAASSDGADTKKSEEPEEKKDDKEDTNKHEGDDKSEDRKDEEASVAEKPAAKGHGHKHHVAVDHKGDLGPNSLLRTIVPRIPSHLTTNSIRGELCVGARVILT